MYCTKCGAQVGPGSAFCSNCGNPLQAQPSSPPTGALPPQPTNVFPPPPTGALPPPPMAYQPQPAPRGGSGWKTCLIIGGSLFVLLLVCGGIGLYTASRMVTSFTQSAFPTIMPALETLAAISEELEATQVVVSIDEPTPTAKPAPTEPAPTDSPGTQSPDTTPLADLPSIPDIEGVPSQESLRYFVEMTQPMSDYGRALGRLGEQTSEVSVDQSLVSDETWKNDTTTVLEELRNAGGRLGSLGTPPPELQGLDGLLKQVSSETPLMIDEYTQGLEQEDFNMILQSQQRLTKISQLFGEMQGELQQFQP